MPTPLTRRQFSAALLAAAAAVPLAARPSRAESEDPKTSDPKEGDDTDPTPAQTKLSILVLGGTAFTGPHFVRRALARGHTVTVFNRGRTEKRIGPLPDAVKRLVGDRDPDVGDGLKALQGDAKWDVVLDASGQIPRHVKASSELLKERTSRYIFISSISALKVPMPNDSGPGGVDESAPAAEIAIPDTESMGPGFENYAGFKAACEKTVADVFATRGCSVRPGLIVGPGDNTDRFTYWPARVAQGGEVLCPGTPSDPVQFIDVRDLAAFLLLLCESSVKATGLYHAVGPDPACTIGALIESCRKAAGSEAKLTFVPADFLEHQGVAPWSDMPVWIPPGTGGMQPVSSAKAKAAGLRSRPVADTVKSTLAWWPVELARRERVTAEMLEQAKKEGREIKMADPKALRAGITRDREAHVLAAWREHTKKD